MNNIIEMFKALANQHRLDILKWLKEPKRFFPEEATNMREMGVCASVIQQQLGLSQSTVSNYLTTLHRAGLVVAQRQGKWTYYKRNEEAIELLADAIEREL